MFPEKVEKNLATERHVTAKNLVCGISVVQIDVQYQELELICLLETVMKDRRLTNEATKIYNVRCISTAASDVEYNNRGCFAERDKI